MGHMRHLPGRALERLAVSLFAIVTVIAIAEPAQAENGDDESGIVLSPLEVIGSLTPVRSVLETAVPVDIVGEERLSETGASETGRAIQAAAPSFNFSSSTISDGTDALRPATLRGLGPDQTLVLINGKRRHPGALVHVNRSVGRGTAGTDINAIPLAAVGRIEVLRDGASARYGSDAIAGVINLVLKEFSEGGELRATLGETYEGDGLVQHISLVHGLPFGEGGFMTITADLRDRAGTNRAGLTGVCQYSQTQSGDCAEPERERTFPRQNFRIGDADSLSRSLWINAEAAASETTSLYAFGGFTRRDNTSGGFYRRSNQAGRNPEFNGAQFYPDGFLPLIETEIIDLSFGIGLALEAGGWDADISLTHGQNRFDFGISNSLNAYIWQQEGRAVTAADAGSLHYRQTSLNLDGRRVIRLFGRDVQLAAGGEFRADNYRIRAGERDSWYGCTDDAANPCTSNSASGGIQVFPGFRPANEVDEDRASGALYLDSEVEAGRRLSLGFALRGEVFEDFGLTVNGKITARYEASPRLALRGAFNTGFRAPSLHQTYFNNISTQFTADGQAQEVGTFRNDSALARDLGIPELEEETSQNVSLGLVWTPLPALSFTLDAYRIGIQDRIMISNFVNEASLTAGCGGDAACEAGVAGALAGIDRAQFFLNAGRTRTWGVDLVAEHERELAGGLLRLTGAASWSRTRFRGGFNAPGLLGGLGSTLFGARDRAFIEVAQPEWRLNFESDYARGPWDLNLGARIYGPYRVPETDGGDLQRYGAKALIDLQAGYRFFNRLTFSIGADNVFDVRPDRKRIGLSRDGCISGDGTTGAPGSCGADPIVDTNGVFAYSRRAAPFGINGGFYYARLSWNY